MKKLAIGCVGVIVIVGAAVVGVGYYGYMKVRSTVAQVSELARIPEIDRGVRVTTPFMVPATGALTAAQVQKFVRVQTQIREHLGASFAALEKNYKSLGQKKDLGPTDLPMLLAAYRDMAAAWLEAKHTQVDALNEAGLSLEEYRWIRSEAYGALGIPLVDVDFGRIAAQVQNGTPQSATVLVGGAFRGEGPPSNKKLVEGYRKQFEDNLPLATFGL